MHFFIHQYIIEIAINFEPISELHTVIDAQRISFSEPLLQGLSGTILLHNLSVQEFKSLIYWLDKKNNLALQKILIIVENKKAFKESIKAEFTIIHAAGGLIRDDHKTLMIYRKKKWDLPKGKVDKGETSAMAAIREIREECNLRASIQEKLCTTWHHYWMGSQIVLKKTKWYLMSVSDPNEAKPQAEEDIEEVRFMNEIAVSEALENTFSSIVYVLDAYNYWAKHK